MTDALHADTVGALLRLHHDGLRRVAGDLERLIDRRSRHEGTTFDDLVPLSEARLEVHAAIVHVERAMVDRHLEATGAQLDERARRTDQAGAQAPALDGVYDVRLHRAEPALRALVSLRHEIAAFIAREGDQVTVHDSADAGSGFSFLLAAWLSLYDGRPVDLRGLQRLDGLSADAFFAMVEAYRRPEEWA